MLSTLNFGNVTAILAREIAGVPTRVVVSERNALTQRSAELRTKRKRRAIPQLVRNYYPLADVVSAVSSGVAEDLARVLGRPAHEIAVTYNPVVGSELKAQAAIPTDHPWFEEGAPPVVLAAGALKPKKDFETLIRSFALLRNKREVRLMILGEGPQRQKLEGLVREFGLGKDVELSGFASNPFSHMARASAFVLSSRFEGLPGVLIQALACGCPVVSTDCPSGPREILMDGKLGPLVPIGSIKSLSLAIDAVLDHPIAAHKLRERAEFFSEERSAERYLASMEPPG
jgi:glycosyltransferase involved in cell wall biosynthesis